MRVEFTFAARFYVESDFTQTSHSDLLITRSSYSNEWNPVAYE